MKKNTVKKNQLALKGGSYSLIITVVLLAILVVVNIFAAHYLNQVRYQLQQTLFHHQQHQGCCQQPEAGCDHLLDRPGRPGRHHH